MRVAPRIALETCGQRSTHAIATGAGSRPFARHHAAKRSAAATFSGVIAFSLVRKFANRVVARLPAGTAPAAYLFVSTPCASGEYTIIPIPFAWQNPTCSGSTCRSTRL